MADPACAPERYEVIPIGIIHSPYKKKGDAPRQGRLSDKTSVIEIFDAYKEGLRDIEKHPHVIVLYWLDRADRTALTAVPPVSGIEHGVFATRSPNRPNPVGFSVADLISRENTRLVVRGLDAFDLTPVIDLKPYSPGIDTITE